MFSIGNIRLRIFKNKTRKSIDKMSNFGNWTKVRKSVYKSETIHALESQWSFGGLGKFVRAAR